jgi:carboxymethylenebutenolidase
MTKIRTVAVPLPDGTEPRFAVAEPDRAVRGGVVVLHEARGVTETIHSLVEGLADEGWLTLAPYLYHRTDPADQLTDGTVGAALDRLTGESALADFDGALAWLAERGIAQDLVGVVGFDLGATVACFVATERSLGAVVSVAPVGITTPVSERLPALVDIADRLRCPWLALHGERDEVDSAADVRKLREVAARAKVANDVVGYPDADHRFDTAPEAAAEAWQRTLNWLDAHLR